MVLMLCARALCVCVCVCVCGVCVVCVVCVWCVCVGPVHRKPVRNGIADVVGIVARITVPSNAWPELLDFLFQCTNSQNVEHREVGMKLFDSLTDMERVAWMAVSLAAVMIQRSRLMPLNFPLACPSPVDAPFRRVKSARILRAPSKRPLC